MESQRLTILSGFISKTDQNSNHLFVSLSVFCFLFSNHRKYFFFFSNYFDTMYFDKFLFLDLLNFGSNNTSYLIILHIYTSILRGSYNLSRIPHFKLQTSLSWKSSELIFLCDAILPCSSGSSSPFSIWWCGSGTYLTSFIQSDRN